MATTLVLLWLILICFASGLVIGYCWGRDVGRGEEPDVIGELLRRERRASR